MKYIKYTCLVLIVIIFHCGGGQERGVKSNTDSGWTKAKGIGDSEREAIEQAKANAIKFIVGEQLQGKSKVINGQLDSSVMMSFFKGFAAQVKVLNKSQKVGIVEVEIECFVDSKEIGNYVENVLISKSKPRFMVLVNEKNLGKDIAPDSGQQTSTEASLISALNDLGFDFVQKSGVVIKLLKEQKGNLSLALQGNANAAKELGSETGAEFVVIGNTSIEEKNNGETGRSLKIVDVGTGSIVATQETYGGDASTNPQFAAMNSVKYAVDEALNGTTDRVGMLRQMLRKWNPGNGNEIQIGLEVKDFDGLSEFTSILEKADSRIVSVDSKGFKPGNSLVQVFFRGSSSDLLKVITKSQEMKERFQKMKVKQQTASQIIMKIE